MAGELMFTQNDKILANRRKNLFVLVGMLPILLATAMLIWTGTVGRLVFGLLPEDTAFIIPGIMVLQLILMTVRMQSIHRRNLKLTQEVIEISGLGGNRRLPIRFLRKIRVKRGNDGTVTDLFLRFSGHSLHWYERLLHLSGFHEMNVLRDTLVQYAGNGKSGLLKISDRSAVRRKHN